MIFDDMDMPKSCFDCDLCNVHDGLVLCHPINMTFKAEKRYAKKRPRNCPLKTVEGLLEKIEEEEREVEYMDNFSNGYNSALSNACKIIKEYCEMED